MSYFVEMIKSIISILNLHLHKRSSSQGNYEKGSTQMPPSMNIPLLLHILIELPASLNFFFRPSATLAVKQPHAHAVIRQYALLLMTSNLITLIFLFRPLDDVSRKIAGALGLYHIGPLVRAGCRIWDGEGRGDGGLGGPWVHMGLHAICAGALLLNAFDLA